MAGQTIHPSFRCRDGRDAIELLKGAFGFEENVWSFGTYEPAVE